MLSTKQQVDTHIANILGRIKDENERNSRGYLCAKLYYGIQEYDIAKRYLAGFLNVRDNYAPAHKLMGQIQDGLNNPELAITAYKRSLDFDERQRDVIIKICELYCKTGVDPERAKYWAERAEKMWPGHPVIFKLRENMVNKKDDEEGAEDLEALITSELVKQPKNPELRAKLLRMYMDTGRINEAYTHGIEVENKYAYPNSLPWCKVLLEVLEAYQKQSGNINGTFHQHLFTVLSRMVSLSLETAKVAEIAEALYKFDQSLSSINKAVVSGPVWDTFLELTQAQYFTYAGHLLLKRAQQDHLSWTDATAMGALCYLASYSVPAPNLQTAWFVTATETEKARYTNWHDAACYRHSEAGHLLANLSGGDGNRWAAKLHTQWVTQQGRGKIHDALFTLRHMKATKDSSFFMTCDLLSAFKPSVPSEQQLRELDKVAHLYESSQLRSLAWFALHSHQPNDPLQPDYGFKVFDDLQFETSTTLDTASPETLSQLDAQAFLYATVHTSALRLAERQKRLRKSESQPRLLPLCFGEDLCSAEQAEWWETAYNLNNNKARADLGRLRLVLQRGIETVRLIGNHGVPISLILHLARVFAVRAQDAVSSASIAQEGYLQDRAVLYWTAAVDVLERLANNQTVWSPKKRLFSDDGSALTEAQIQAGLEEGWLYLAVQAMHSGKQEEAIEMFDKLKSPEACFHQAQIYRMMADEAEHPDDGEDSIQVILLTKARDALYLTLDRLRGERHHKLTSVLPTEIDDVESKLNRLISGAGAGADADESVRSLAETTPRLPQPSHTVLQAADSFINTSTPMKPSHPRTPPTEQFHMRPSPEKLDAQMRSLAMSQEVLIKQLMEQNEELRKQNKLMAQTEQLKKLFTEEITKNREEIEKLKTKLENSNAAAPTLPPQPPPPMAAMAPGSPAMHPGVDRSALRPPMPPAAAASPYYAAYRPHEYDYPGGTPHPPPPLAAYSPHPHAYPFYAPPPPPMAPHYPYPPPPTHQPPPAMTAKQTMPKVPAPTIPTVVQQQEEEEDDYYLYDDDDDYDEDGEDPMINSQPPVIRDPQMPAVSAGGGSFQVPDSQLIQDWPYGNNVNLEGKSTLTYSPTHPLPPPPASYFPQIVAPPARAQVPSPAMYGSPVVSVPPAPIGPGFFSSPERPGFPQRFQSPTHIPIPASQGAVVVGLPGQAAALTPPKPGFLPSAGVQPTLPASAKIPPPNASLTANGGVIDPPARPNTSSASAAALTGGNIFKMGDAVTKPPATTDSPSFGTKFIMTMPAGTSGDPKPPASLSTPPFSFGLSDGKNPSFIDNPEEEEDDTLAGEDSYQGPDFEPVIPLPDEVEVVTGEEEETVLFGARTKLFRFTEKQWKERGLGEIKILHHKSGGGVRIVMRREQVHKVCANHSLNPEMTIDFKSPTEKKVLTWQAMDFTEGESQMEQFCAKFKSEDIASQFKASFEQGVKLSSQKKTVKEPAAKAGDVKRTGLFDKFKPKVGSWDCDSCMVNNPPETKKCLACATPKPGATPEKEAAQPKAGGFSFGTAGAGAAAPGGFTFGTGGTATPGAAGFAFGSGASSAAGVTTTTPASSTKPASSLFGTPGSSGFSFGNQAATAGDKSGSSPFTFPNLPATSTPGKPSIVFGSSGTPATSTPNKPAPTTVSTEKSNVVTSAEATSTTASGTKPAFSFGKSSFAPATSFKFGESKPLDATTTTPAADMLKALAGKAKPTDTPDPKAANQVGGFTFTSAPLITEKKQEKPQEEKKTEDTTKVSPFAGFSFGKTQKDSTPVFGGTSSLGGTESAGMPSFGSQALKGQTASEADGKQFGSDSTDGQTFGGLVTGGTAKPDAFNKSSNFKGFSGAGQQLFAVKSPQKKGEEGADDEYEPDVDFQPLIPLPDLVAVETGEEDEDRLFSDRVKLFRHDQDTKQWKERGIGEIKILKQKETNRCRLLMRREQVLKICCNQMITPDIRIQKLATSDKAWCWLAQDFSEGEVKIEQFACKFKSIDAATKFKEVYEAAAQLKVIEPSVKPSVEKLDKSKPSLKEMFKAKPGEWQCDTCYVKSTDPEKCPACQTPKPGVEPPKAKSEVSSTVPDSGFKFGSAGGFKFGNASANETEKSKTESKSGSSLKELFKPTPSAEQPKAKSEVSSTVPDSGFKFGSAGGFKFGNTAANETEKPKTVSKSGGSLKELFKPKPGEWQCDACYVKSTDPLKCPACETPKPGAEQPKAKSDVSSTVPDSGFKFGNMPGKEKESSDSSKAPQSLKELLTSTDETSKSGEVSSTTGAGFSSFKFDGTKSFTFGKSDENKASATPQSSAPFSFTPSSSTTGSTIFGKESAAKADEKKTSPFSFTPSKPGDVSSSSGSGFVFGSDNANSSFSFSGVTPSKPLDLSATRSPRSPGGDDFYVNQDGDDSHIYFEPIVQLEKVEVKTGEEDEDVQWSHRAKCFRFDSTEWKERGLGDVKILIHHETKKRRIIMRREQIHKLCLNHFLSPDLELVPMANSQGKAWVWHADDFVDNELQHEQLAIRFKTKEIADEFKAEFLKAQQANTIHSTPTKKSSDAKTPSKDTGSESTAKELMTEKSTTEKKSETPTKESVQSSQISSSDDKEEPKPVFGGAATFSFKPTSSPADSGKGKVFGAPVFGASSSAPSFGTAQGFSFGTAGLSPTSIFGGAASSSKPDEASSASPLTKGKSLLATMLSQGNDADGDDDDIEIVFEQRATPEQVEKARKLMLPDHFYLYENKEPCPGCIGCDDGEGKMVRKETSDDVIYMGEDQPTADQLARAKDLQLPSNFYMYENKPQCPGCPGCEDSDQPKTCSRESPAKKETQPSLTDSSKDSEPSSTTMRSFGEGAKEAEFSFSAIAASTGGGFNFGQQKETGKPFAWQGAGRTLFASPTQRSGEDEDEDGVAPSDDIHFEPLVSLPEVEVRTGEEEEDVLYSQRAKLFRFDNKTNQWKERGVGDMKLLKHHETGKVRVLMRREQVLKIACNHQLSPDMKLNPLQTSEVAWCWYALDIAEGEPRHEHLAIKFKTKILAEQFKEKFTECQAMLSASQAGGDNCSNTPAKAEPATPTRDSVSESDVTSPGSAQDEADDDYEDDEEEDLRPWFAKRASLYYKQGDKWELAGMGELEVVYDDDVCGGRIIMTSDDNVNLCNHIICREYSLQCNEAKKHCEWTARDFATDDPVRRTFRLQFSSKSAVHEFNKTFELGREKALEWDLHEKTDYEVGGCSD